MVTTRFALPPATKTTSANVSTATQTDRMRLVSISMSAEVHTSAMRMPIASIELVVTIVTACQDMKETVLSVHKKRIWELQNVHPILFLPSHGAVNAMKMLIVTTTFASAMLDSKEMDTNVIRFAHWMNISAMEVALNCRKSKKVREIMMMSFNTSTNFLQSAEEIQPYCNSQGDCNCPHGYKLIEYAHTSVCRIDDEAGEGEYQQESCDVVNSCHRSAECEFDQATNRYECICGPGYDGELNINLIVGNFLNRKNS